MTFLALLLAAVLVLSLYDLASSAHCSVCVRGFALFRAGRNDWRCYAHRRRSNAR